MRKLGAVCVPQDVRRFSSRGPRSAVSWYSCDVVRSLPDLFTYPEYLARASTSDVPLEYHDGAVLAVGAPTTGHARLCARVAELLSVALQDRPCVALPAGLKVRVEATNRTLLPDLTVVCGELVRSDTDHDAVVNPVLVVEVLSPTTEDDDRGTKFHHYRRLATLQEYVLVAQSAQWVSVARRSGDLWQFDDVTSGELRLNSIDATLSLSDLYTDALGDILGR